MAGLSIFGKISKYILYLVIFLTPLFFFPSALNVLDYPKQTIFSSLILISLIFWILDQSVQKKVTIRLNKKLYIFLGIILIFSLISSFFSLWRYGSFFGWPLNISESFISVLTFIIFLFLLYNLISENKEIKALFFTILLSTIISAIFVPLQLYNLFVLPFNVTRISTFNFLGSSTIASLFFLAVLPLILSFYFLSSSKKPFFAFLAFFIIFFNLLFLNSKISWIVLFFVSIFFLFFEILKENSEWRHLLIGFLSFFLILSLFFIFFRIPIPKFPPVPSEVTLNFAAEYIILKSVFKEQIKNIFVGTGPGTFVFDYSKYRPPVLNQTIFWGTRFAQGYSSLFDLLISYGIFGFLAFVGFWLWIFILAVRTVLKEKEDKIRLIIFGEAVSFLILILSHFFYPTNFSLFFLTYFVIGILLISIDHTQNQSKSIYQKSISAVTSLVLVGMFILSLLLIFLIQRGFLAHVIYAKGQRLSAENLEKSLQYFNKAVRYNPFVDAYFRDLAQAYLSYANKVANDKNIPNEKKSELAFLAVSEGIKAINKAIQINPKNVANWNVRGFFYRNLIGMEGAGEIALDSYKKAAQLEPASPFAFGEIGRVYILMAQDFAKKGDTKAREDALRYARQNLETAISLKSDYAPAHYLLAVVYDQQGNSDEAIEKLKETIRITPNDLGVLFQLGVLYWRKGEFLEAKDAFERALDINANYSNARYMLGLVYDKLGEREKAKEEFEKVIQLNPENEEVKKILENLNQGKPALEGIISSTQPLQISPSEINQ